MRIPKYVIFDEKADDFFYTQFYQNLKLAKLGRSKFLRNAGLKIYKLTEYKRKRK